MLYVGTSAGNLTAITPDPSEFEWGLQDISSSDAGRVQDEGNSMYKMRLSQKRKVKLKWTLITDHQASAILRAFNPEYFYVRYFDLLEDAFVTKEFYAGDRSAPFKSFQNSLGTRVNTLSFDIIEV